VGCCDWTFKKKRTMCLLSSYFLLTFQGWWQIDWSTAKCKCYLETNASILTITASDDDDDTHRRRSNR
jgi:hypothetical protein